MKTMLLFLFLSISLHPLFAQYELAMAVGTPPHRSALESDDSLTSDPAFAANTYTVDEQVIIRLGRGFGKALQLQVLTPSAELLFDKEIPAGQKSIRIDLAGLPDGHYTFRIKSGNKVWIKQVSKS